ncbi:unnamed protein product [Urochloa humidicola]
MPRKGEAAARRIQTRLGSSSAALVPAPPPMEQPKAPVFILTDDALCLILRRLSIADLLRAALVCRWWRRAVSLSLPRPPPLLGYFFHPDDTPPPPPITQEERILYPAVFLPFGAPAAAAGGSPCPCLSLDFAPEVARCGYSIQDVHLGLLLLLPCKVPEVVVPRSLVLDPASRRRALLPPPPRDALPDDRWRRTRKAIGVAVLSRAHPSRLSFDAVCFTVDGDRPRAWVASVRDGDCTWRALPRSTEVKVDFDPMWFEKRCVHAAGKIYWHICNSNRVLSLDPRTLEFSYLLAPAQLGNFSKYRIGEMPEDGQLCIASAEDEQLQVYVRWNAKRSDNGWLLVRHMSLRKVFDSVPRLPRGLVDRIAGIWLSDIDAGRTGRVFIKTLGYGRYSFDMETGKLECLVTEDGQEHGHPIYAYYLAWPPAFLVSSEEMCN